MPIFEYRCQACSHRFEQLTFGRGETTCPSCQSKEVQKLLSAFAVGGAGSGSSGRFDAGPQAGGCGSCGDPRGPGACRMN